VRRWRFGADAMRRLLIGLVRGYQLFFSAWLGSGCRFEPTCSTYAIQALQRHGAWAGSGLTARRLLRCHPACSGGCDPVPEQLHAWAPGWLTRATNTSSPLPPTESKTS
jgi:putative membrane protein insertion efficiency factor